MVSSTKIFRNIDKLDISAVNIIVIIFAFLGALLSFLAYQWLTQVSTQTVDILPKEPRTTAILKTTSASTIIKRLDVDVALVTDWSGTIHGYIGSYPNTLMLKASEMMISSLATDIFDRHTRLGYVQFAKSAIVAQELVDVDDKSARLEMINKIYNLSPDIPEDSNWTAPTNISDAFSTAGTLLDKAKAKNDPKYTSNTPAIVFLTNGSSANEFMSKDVVESVVRKLINKGTIVFVVILRNPNNPDPDNVNEIGNMMPTSETWRSFWYEMSSKNPEYVKYFEAQDDTQLQGICNMIRARLVKEGTKPADRLEYNPLDSNAFIDIPPGLLQAHLLVNRPSAITSIKLTPPNGLNFEQGSKKNDILEGNLFYMFSIYRPSFGKWKLVTNTKQSLYYLLITESIYTVHPYPFGRDPYLDPGTPTELPFFVLDDQQNPVNDKDFSLKAYSVETIQQQDGSYAEETISLADLKSVIENGEKKYVLTVTPDLLAGKDTLQIQIDGASSDGAPVNISSYTIPILPAPSGIRIDAPAAVVCESEKIIWWPPTIQCGNDVKITAIVQGSEHLLDGSLYGKLYSPIASKGTDMNVVAPSTLQANIKPLLSAGKYQIAIDAGGKIGSKGTDFEWQKRGWATIQVSWPLWVEPMKHSTWFAFVLLLVIALWKPVIVAVLLPIFAILRAAPNGFYTDHDDEDGFPAQIYGLAMKHRKLFALTIGIYKRSDITIFLIEDPFEANFTSSRYDRLMLKLYRWLKAQPRARVVTVPWSGVWVEKPSGEFEKANERTYTNIAIDGANVRIGQHDWKDEDINS